MSSIPWLSMPRLRARAGDGPGAGDVIAPCKLAMRIFDYFPSHTLAMVSAVGPARQGKSTLLNHLVACAMPDGGGPAAAPLQPFRIATGERGEPDGVEAFDAGCLQHSTTRVVFADTKGLCDGSSPRSAVASVPVLLASSAIVFNTRSATREAVLNELSALVTAARSVRRDESAGADVTGPVFGHLHIVLRDFALDNWDGEWHRAEIFTRHASEAQQHVQEAVMASFASVTVHVLPRNDHRPGMSTDRVMDHMVSFDEGVALMWQVLQRHITTDRPAGILCSQLTGGRFALFTSAVCDALASSAIVATKDVYERMVLAECMNRLDGMLLPVRAVSWPARLDHEAMMQIMLHGLHEYILRTLKEFKCNRAQLAEYCLSRSPAAWDAVAERYYQAICEVTNAISSTATKFVDSRLAPMFIETARRRASDIPRSVPVAEQQCALDALSAGVTKALRTLAERTPASLVPRAERAAAHTDASGEALDMWRPAESDVDVRDACQLIERPFLSPAVHSKLLRGWELHVEAIRRHVTPAVPSAPAPPMPSSVPQKPSGAATAAAPRMSTPAARHSPSSEYEDGLTEEELLETYFGGYPGQRCRDGTPDMRTSAAKKWCSRHDINVMEVRAAIGFARMFGRAIVSPLPTGDVLQVFADYHGRRCADGTPNLATIEGRAWVLHRRVNIFAVRAALGTLRL